MHLFVLPFKKYITFSGRASRAEFWGYILVFLFAVSIIAALLNVPDLVFQIYLAALLLPTIAVSVRRLHDIGKSGWYYFLNLIPLIGSLILFVMYVQDSKPYNVYGPSPKGAQIH